MLLKVPFFELHGESTEYVGRAEDAIIALSNYRLHIKFKESVVNVSENCISPGDGWEKVKLGQFLSRGKCP